MEDPADYQNILTCMDIEKKTTPLHAAPPAFFRRGSTVQDAKQMQWWILNIGHSANRRFSMNSPHMQSRVGGLCQGGKCFSEEAGLVVKWMCFDRRCGVFMPRQRC